MADGASANRGGVQCDAITRQIAETQPWYRYGMEFRAIARDGRSNTIAAYPDGGIVMLYVLGGKVESGVEVGPFRFELGMENNSYSDDSMSYKPEFVRYLGEQA